MTVVAEENNCWDENTAHFFKQFMKTKGRTGITKTSQSLN